MCADHERSDERRPLEGLYIPAQVVCHSKEIVLDRQSFFYVRLSWLAFGRIEHQLVAANPVTNTINIQLQVTIIFK